jgi:hypothetical protein
VRLAPGDFEPDDLEDAEFKRPLNLGDWYTGEGKPDYASVSNAYFAHAIVAEEAAAGRRPSVPVADRAALGYGSLQAAVG